MTKVILTVKETHHDNNAGPKAKIDVENFLLKDGFEKWNFTINQESVLQKAKVAYIDVPRFLAKQNDIDEIFLQYPTYSKIVTKQLVKRLQQMNSKIILIIHDIESLRLHYGEKGYIDEELRVFNMADGLIVHNAKMEKWLRDNGVTVPMESLGLFDYDNKIKLASGSNYETSVCFAGNLSKAGFLEKLSLKRVKLNVFGPNPLEKYGANIVYKGQYPPDELPNYLKGNFGLVWDGTTPITCDGLFGNYMKFNNPHKASLYLSSGIPVVVWRQATIADLVEKMNVGIVVDSLNELDEVLPNVSSIDYSELVNNAKEVAEKLRSGFYIKTAISNLEKGLV